MAETALTRAAPGVDCAACHVSMTADAWPSHYRTRAHRTALARLHQATGYQAAIGQWVHVPVGLGPPWPLHLQMQGDHKFVATIYAPPAAPVTWRDRNQYSRLDFAATMAALFEASGRSHYWRGESFIGFDEAMRNAAAALAAERMPTAEIC